jgi:hypothetical protein
VIKLSEYHHLVLYCLQVILELLLVHYFNGHLVLRVGNVVSQKNFPEGSLTKNFCIVVDQVI